MLVVYFAKTSTLSAITYLKKYLKAIYSKPYFKETLFIKFFLKFSLPFPPHSTLLTGIDHVPACDK